MVKVYRVEDINGVGPYQSDLADDLLDRYGNPRQPGPVDDGIPPPAFNPDLYKFGFADLSQVLSWFNARERWGLAERGFVLSEYTVPSDKVLRGNHQIAYVAPAAKLVKRKPLTHIESLAS